MKKILIALGTLSFLGILGVVGFVMKVASDLPSVEKIRNYQPPVPSVVLDRQGEVLMQLGSEYREIVPFPQIPKVMINAVLAAEDGDFFQHSGIDLWGLMRAMAKNLMAGRVVQGGSTITQQVAKALLLSNEKTVLRKVKDFLLAVAIEESFSKEEILFLYLNQSYLGSGHYGIGAASKGYFGQELSKITIAQAAMLAGLLSAPGRYSPFLNSKYCKRRQLYVLERMRANGFITPEELSTAKKEVIKLLVTKEQMIAPYFTEWIRLLVTEEIGEEAFFAQGLKIKTTLDKQWQLRAEEAIARGVQQTDRRQGFVKPDPSKRSPDLVKADEVLKQQLIAEHAPYQYLSPEGKLLNEDQLQQTLKVKDAQQALPQNLSAYLQTSQQLSSQMGLPLLAPFQDHPILMSLLTPGKRYPAMVLKTNSALRLIFMTVGGQVGVIPWDHFKWAHSRKISANTTFSYLQVTDPAALLMPGDHIMVVYEPAANQGKTLLEWIPSEVKKNISPMLKAYAQQSKFQIFSLVQDEQVEGALVSMDAKTGEILAFVGGKNFWKSKFNRAVQALRQPGSSIKPFIYAAGLEQSFTPLTLLMDAPQALSGVDELSAWRPKNYDGEFKGMIPFRMSLEESRNVSTIYLMQQLGIKKVKELLHRVGIRGNIPDDMSISLGSFGISLLDLVSAYRIFPAKGQKTYRKVIEKIVDRNGKYLSELEKKIDQKINQHLAATESTSELKDKQSEKQAEAAAEVEKKYIDFVGKLPAEKIYDERLAYIMTTLLQGVVGRGTAQELSSLGYEIGGKTGTTSDYVDSWFVGFTPQIVTGVWVGFDDNTTLGYGETGAQTALPIWKEFMTYVIAQKPLTPFPRPAGLESQLVNRKTGRIVKAPGVDVLTEFTVPGTLQSGPQVVESLAGSLNPQQVNNTASVGEGDEAAPSAAQAAAKSAVLPEADDYWSQQ